MFPFVTINDTRDACIGYSLVEDYFKKNRVFELKWTVLKVKYGVIITKNKCHIVIDHIQQFISRTGKSEG